MKSVILKAGSFEKLGKMNGSEATECVRACVCERTCLPVRVCVCERERERERVHVHAWVCVGEHGLKRVCVCVRERPDATSFGMN